MARLDPRGLTACRQCGEVSTEPRGSVASPCDEGIAFVTTRGEDGASAAWIGHRQAACGRNGRSKSLDAPGGGDRPHTRQTPPPRNAIELSSPVDDCVDSCDGRAKLVAFRPPPSCVPKAPPSSQGEAQAKTADYGERALAKAERGPRGTRDRGIASLLAVLLAVVLGLANATAALADPKFPPLTGRIVDEAALLSVDDRRALEQELKALEAKSTDQLVIYTTRSLQGYPIEDFGYRLGRTWAIGQKDKNNGAILIVAPSDRKVRIEVGRGLEPQLTDLMTKLIIENAILPAFRRNDFVGGIKAGVRDIRDVLLGDAEAVKQRAKGAAKRSPGGGSNFPLLILALFVLIAFSMVWMQSRQTANPNRLTRDRRRDSPSASPWSSGSWGGGSGSWGGGSSGGGGGFSGGGGDFGGGGSSGSW